MAFADEQARRSDTPPAQTTDALGDSLPDDAVLRLGTIRWRHPTPVTELALSPDEQTVITLGPTIIAWDVATGKERWQADYEQIGQRLSGPCYGSRMLCFTQDGLQFFTPGRRNEVILWTTADGTYQTLSLNSEGLAILQADQQNAIGPARSIDLSPDQKLLAFGSAVGMTVCERNGDMLYEIPNNPPKPIAPEAVSQDRLLAGGHYSEGLFSPDGRLLAFVNSDHPEEIDLRAARDGQPIRTINTSARVVRFAFSPDSRRLVASERDHAVRLYDTQTGRQIWQSVVPLNNPYENYTSDVGISPDGSTVAVGATDNLIHLLDAKSGRPTAVLTGHAWYPWSIAFSRKKNLLYSAGWDGPIRRWDLKSKQPLGPPQGHHGSPVVALSPDADSVAYCDDQGRIHIVDVRSRTDRQIVELKDANITQMAFSRDGKQLAAGGSTDTEIVVAVWDLPDQVPRRRWQWPKGRDPHSHVEAICFSPDADRLAAAVFRQSAAYLWDLNSNRQIAVLKHTQVYGLSFSSDGRKLATAGWDRIIRFWQSSTGELLREYNTGGAPDRRDGGDRRMYAICFAAVGNRMATAHMDGMVRVWNSDTMDIVSSFRIDGRFAYGALSFAGAGAWLATGSASGLIEVWDASRGSRVYAAGKHQSHIYTVGFSGDGRTLVSGGDDGIGYVWNLNRRPVPQNQTATGLWEQFVSDDPETAFQARGALLERPGVLVELLREKLQPVRIVIDMQAALRQTAQADADRRRSQILQLVQKEPQTELLQTVERCLRLLTELRTPESLELLRELSQKTDSVIGGMAADALREAQAVNAS